MRQLKQQGRDALMESSVSERRFEAERQAVDGRGKIQRIGSTIR
jgi:hypothetical protein